jgi:hypothetical protein
MLEQLEKKNISSKTLGSVVDEASTDMAANANNSGMKQQINYLKLVGYSDEDIWESILIRTLETGMSVDVSEPKHQDSPHSCSFTGTVDIVLDSYVRVRDMEDNYWDVNYDEIVDFDLGSIQPVSAISTYVVNPKGIEHPIIIFNQYGQADSISAFDLISNKDCVARVELSGSEGFYVEVVKWCDDQGWCRFAFRKFFDKSEAQNWKKLINTNSGMAKIFHTFQNINSDSNNKKIVQGNF